MELNSYKVCSKCKRKLPLNNKYFEVRSKGSKDGFRGTCRECKKGKIILDGIEYYKCTSCKTIKVLNESNFEKSTKYKNGYHKKCIVCMRESGEHNEKIEGYKVCSKCKQRFPLDNKYFERRTESEDGFRGVCRACRKGYKIIGGIKYAQCTSCKEELELNEENFTKNKGNIYGYSYICRTCKIKNKRNYEHNESSKKCKKCGRELPLDKNYFEEDKLCLDGLRNVCRECKGESFGERRVRREWTDKEIDILKQNYSFMSTKQLNEKFMPYRSSEQIKDFATKVLNLYKNEEYLSERYWSKKQDKFIIENYSNMDTNEIAKLLDKSSDSVRWRAIKLGVQKDSNWSEEEVNLLVEEYPYLSNRGLWKRYFKDRTFYSVIVKSMKLNLKKDDNYLSEVRKNTGIKNLKANVHGILIGENHPKYKPRLKLNCEYCGKVIYRLASDIAKNKNTFCSIECRDKWKSENLRGENNPLYGVTHERWTSAKRKEQAEIMVKRLKESDFKFGKTKPQREIDNLLNYLNIRFENEYDCKYYLIDNYLIDYNLMIEVQGNFFHCNPTMNLKNSREKNIIKKDKAKHTYIKMYKQIDILYIWEKDIYENIDLCRELILLYIKNEGKIDNYHSFNYYLSNKELTLRDDLFNIGY